MTERATPMEALADAVFMSLKAHFAKPLEAVTKRLDELEQRMLAIPAGPPGRDGKDGASVELAEIRSLVAEAVLELPPARDGRDGIDGKSVELVEIERLAADLIAKEVAQIPVPRDGKDGRDGKDVDPESVRLMIDGVVAKAIAAIPTPKDGAPGRDGERGEAGQQGPQGEKGAAGDAGEPGEAGAPGKDGRDGIDGRDGTQIEPLDAIDESRSYERGTHAFHRGGEIRAFRKTDPLRDGLELERAGWEVTRDGVAGTEIEHGEPGEATIRIVLTSGKSTETTIRTPRVRHRGVYAELESYEIGDMVTRSGSVWHCNGDVTGAPGVDLRGWTLAVKGRLNS